jgi:heat shock protein HslJ
MRTLLRVTLLAALSALALASAGCAAVNGAPELDGTTWVLTAWSVSSASATDFTITVHFDDGTIGGQAPVNSYGGEYTVKGDALTTSNVARTLMAGSPEADHAEAVYFELLDQAKRITVDDDTLTLSDEDGNELLVFASAK